MFGQTMDDILIQKFPLEHVYSWVRVEDGVEVNPNSDGVVMAQSIWMVTKTFTMAYSLCIQLFKHPSQLLIAATHCPYPSACHHDQLLHDRSISLQHHHLVHYHCPTHSPILNHISLHTTLYHLPFFHLNRRLQPPSRHSYLHDDNQCLILVDLGCSFNPLKLPSRERKRRWERKKSDKRAKRMQKRVMW